MYHHNRTLSAATRKRRPMFWMAFITAVLLLSIPKAGHAQWGVWPLHNNAEELWVEFDSGRISGSGAGLLSFTGNWHGELFVEFLSAEQDITQPYDDWIRARGTLRYSPNPALSPSASVLFNIGFDYPRINGEGGRVYSDSTGSYGLYETFRVEHYNHTEGTHPGRRIDRLSYVLIASFVPAQSASAPEPGTLALLGVGLGMIGFAARRRIR